MPTRCATSSRLDRTHSVFHAATMTKLDLFPAVGTFERSQISRAILLRGARLMSAEDVLLAKYLGRWAADLGVSDLLQKALADRTGGV